MENNVYILNFKQNRADGKGVTDTLLINLGFRLDSRIIQYELRYGFPVFKFIS